MCQGLKRGAIRDGLDVHTRSMASTNEQDGPLRKSLNWCPISTLRRTSALKCRIRMIWAERHREADLRPTEVVMRRVGLEVYRHVRLYVRPFSRQSVREDAADPRQIEVDGGSGNIPPARTVCEHGRSSTGLKTRPPIISQVQPTCPRPVQASPPPSPVGVHPPGVRDHTRPGPDLVHVLAHVPELVRQGPKPPVDAAPVRSVPARVSSSMHQMQPGIPQCISPWPAAAMAMLDVSECLLFHNKLEYVPIYMCSFSGFAPLCIYLMYGNSPHVHLFYAPAHSCCFCSFSASLCNVSN